MRRRPRLALGLALTCLIGTALPGSASSASALVEQPGFRVTTILSGLNEPTAVAFAPDGRIFVTERGGVIKAFDGMADTTSTTVVDMSAEVHAVEDRGMLGLAIDPDFATGRPYLYVTYTRDAPPGGGTAPTYNDTCPRDPATGARDACPAPGRLFRLSVGADSRMVAGSGRVIIGDGFWCYQAQTHVLAHAEFGPDGALYVSSGEGAGAVVTDYGQQTGAPNPCGDPPEPVGTTLSLPTTEGGALRSQDLLTSADPAGGGGSVVRVHPDTGAAMAGNPLIGNGVPSDDRHIAFGLRNPFRFTFRPGTSEIWVGDVGWNTWEEVNRIRNPTDSTVENFGWPCYEGNGRQPQWDNLNVNMCEDLYAGTTGAVTAPYWPYRHSQSPGGPSCASGGGAVSGVAFSEGDPFPTAYNGALFVADYAKGCIWALLAGADGLPKAANLRTVVSGVFPVDLEIGPDKRLYFVDIAMGTVERIDYFSGNQPPVARFTATPDSGPLDLTVDFSAAGTTDDQPTSQLTYAWDLDGDGAYDDATGVTTSRTYTNAGAVDVGLRATDAAGASHTTTVEIQPGNTRPSANIDAPVATQRWATGEEIAFSGSGSDADEGDLDPSTMRWTVTLFHCQTPADCHAHPQAERTGLASDTFVAPEHSHPAYLEFSLTVTDSGGLTDTETVRVDPRTVDLTLQTDPAGLQLLGGEEQGTAPLTVTAIVGSNTSLSAPTPQSVGGVTYDFASWSDGGPASHDVLATTTDATYTATYQARASVGSALLVVGNGGAPIAADLAVRDRLVALGYVVTVVDDAASQASQASGKAIVVIASSVTPASVNTKFAAVTVPVITWEWQLYDDLGLTAAPGGSVPSQTTVRIVTPGHPLAAGLAGTPTTATAGTYYGWGSPNANATIVATVTAGGQATIFAYEAGAVMPGRTAPARRTALFMGDNTAKYFSAAGQALFDAAVNWSVGAAEPPPSDTTPPIVTGRSPAPGETGVSTTAGVTATFNEALDPSTVDGSRFSLSSGAGTVAATIGYNSSTRVATLTPSSPLTASTTYTALLDGGPGGLTDIAGNELAADDSWSFTTAASPPTDTTAPTVTSRAPAPDASGVGPGGNVTATFSEALDTATVSGSTFSLAPASGPAVSATVSNSPSNLATLDPTADLQPGITYTATLKGGAAGIKDAAGNPLADDVSWSFTTATEPPPPPPPAGEWSHIGTGALVATATASSTTVSAPLPGGTQAGDLLLLGCQGRDNLMNWSASGYTSLVGPVGPGGTRLELEYKWAGASEPSSVTVTNATGRNGWSCSITALRGGVGSGSPLDVPPASQFGTGATMTAPSVTTVTTGALVTRWFASADDNNHGTPSAGTLAFGGTGYHTLTGVDHASSMSHLVDATPGATGTGTMKQIANGADAFVGITLALRPASPP